MLQIEIVEGEDRKTLTKSANEFLAKLDSDAVKGIKYDLAELVAIVEYEMAEEWKKCLCADCKHWDDGGSTDSLIGLCQMCGGRKRFNSKACEKFADVRR